MTQQEEPNLLRIARVLDKHAERISTLDAEVEILTRLLTIVEDGIENNAQQLGKHLSELRGLRERLKLQGEAVAEQDRELKAEAQHLARLEQQQRDAAAQFDQFFQRLQTMNDRISALEDK